MNWRISDKNPIKVALIGVAVFAVLIALALSFQSLPFMNSTKGYSADLTNASGLVTGDAVQVRGVRVGKVNTISLHHGSVRVQFEVNDDVHLGDQTSAAVKVLNPLGTGFLQLTPAGGGRLSGPIPVSRTDVARTLLGDLGQVSTQVQQLDLGQLQKALNVTTTNLSATSAEAVRRALTGLSSFSATLGDHAADIQKIVTQGSSLAKILADRKGELVNLIGQGNAVLNTLRDRQQDISALLTGTSDLAMEINSILQVNEKELNPMLTDLQNISQVLAQENHSISASLPLLASLSSHLSAASGNGAFLDVVIPNGLLPDALIQQCQSSAYPAPKNPVVGCRP